MGAWGYFGINGQLIERYDYTNRKPLPVQDKDTLNGEAGFIGGDFMKRNYLAETFDFNGLMETINSEHSMKTGALAFEFVVNQYGQVGEVETIEQTIDNKKFFERALTTVRSLDGRMYPKRVNNVATVAKKRIIFSLSVDSKTRFSTFGPYHEDSTNMDFDFVIKVE